MMPLANQIDGSLRPVDNGGEKIGDIPTQYTHIESCHVAYRSIVTPKRDFAVIFTAEPHPGFDKHRVYLSPDTPDTIFSSSVGKAKRSENVCAQDRAISLGIDKERRFDP